MAIQIGFVSLDPVLEKTFVIDGRDSDWVLRYQYSTKPLFALILDMGICANGNSEVAMDESILSIRSISSTLSRKIFTKHSTRGQKQYRLTHGDFPDISTFHIRTPLEHLGCHFTPMRRIGAGSR